MKKLFIPLLFITFLIQSCGPDKAGNSSKQTLSEGSVQAATPSVKTLISDVNSFSCEIFQHIVAADSTQNVFVSPLSISMALGMALNGADGSTRVGILKTLDIDGMKLHKINQSYKNLTEGLVNLDPKVAINIANSLWSRKGFPIHQSYKDTLRAYFNTQAEPLDFSNPSSAEKINHWVEKQTGGRIDEIISGEIPPSMMLYLINAVYFKGSWQYKFNPDKTNSAPFHLEDGSTVKAEMMHREAPMAVYKSDEVHIAQLAYGDSLYQMDILMPADTATPINQFVQQQLTAENVSKWTGQLSSGKKKIALPKFKISYKKTLNSVLEAMGMEEAFDKGKADFSGISDNKGLYISKVLHKANITVDEEGSEAAAVTSVGVKALAMHFGFRVNRPFVYIIRDSKSGAILFMGVMRNPAE